ncbi:hypothetical protein BJ742DRAFT_145216 [Cladochytrium replicatum]|nr:hypothetical protein BJ742DRAFT_145216 [Cladochytrium replicatum]
MTGIQQTLSSISSSSSSSQQPSPSRLSNTTSIPPASSGGNSHIVVAANSPNVLGNFGATSNGTYPLPAGPQLGQFTRLSPRTFPNRAMWFNSPQRPGQAMSTTGSSPSSVGQDPPSTLAGSANRPSNGPVAIPSHKIIPKVEAIRQNTAEPSQQFTARAGSHQHSPGKVSNPTMHFGGPSQSRQSNQFLSTTAPSRNTVTPSRRTSHVAGTSLAHPLPNNGSHRPSLNARANAQSSQSHASNDDVCFNNEEVRDYESLALSGSQRSNHDDPCGDDDFGYSAEEIDEFESLMYEADTAFNENVYVLWRDDDIGQGHGDVDQKGKQLSSPQSSQKDSECSVCLESLSQERLVVLPCTHRFHFWCALDWLQREKDTCPMCRAVVKREKPGGDWKTNLERYAIS